MSCSKNDSKLKEKILCRYSSEQGKSYLVHSRSGIQPFMTTEKNHSFALLYLSGNLFLLVDVDYPPHQKKFVLLAKHSSEFVSTLNDMRGNQQHIF